MKKILVVPLLSIGLSMPAITLGSPIEPGFDLLKTECYLCNSRWETR